MKCCIQIPSVVALIAVGAAFSACSTGAKSSAPAKSAEAVAVGVTAPAIQGLLCAPASQVTEGQPVASLASAFEGKFKIGLALSYRTLFEESSAGRQLAAAQFNRLTSENSMKWESIEPEEGKFDFERADALLKFAAEHNLEVHGHTLMWHQQTPQWVFQGPDGKPAGRELVLARLEAHMKGLAEHFQGQIAYWDVVNEAFLDSGEVRMESPWSKAVGADFLERAFELAARYFPEAKLGYNDYNLTKPEKRAAAVKLVGQLRAAGLRIDAVGMQAHYRMDFPKLDAIEQTILDLSAAGVEVLATELDVDVLPRKGTGADLDEKSEGRDLYPDCLPADVAKKVDERWASIFALYNQHHDKISSVTLWGLSDALSWRNDFPVRGRTNYALLFDRALQPKGMVPTIVKMGQGQ